LFPLKFWSTLVNMALIDGSASLFKVYWFPGLFFLIVLHFAINRYGRGLHKIPGPFLASVTDFWRMYHAYSNKGHRDYLLHREYHSPILRIGPKTVAVADPDAIKIIYGWKPLYRKVCSGSTLHFAG
jgi:hypothetical protein